MGFTEDKEEPSPTGHPLQVSVMETTPRRRRTAAKARPGLVKRGDGGSGGGNPPNTADNIKGAF